MIGLCVLTIGVVLGSLGISNSINGLQNTIIMQDMKRELHEVKEEMKSVGELGDLSSRKDVLQKVQEAKKRRGKKVLEERAIGTDE